MDWKTQKCDACTFSERAPRDPTKPVDLTEPRILICRHSPPNVLFAVAGGPNGQPHPVPLGSMYPMMTENNQACSQFKEHLTLN